MTASEKKPVSSFELKTHIVGILVLTVCMLVNCWHSHLWGPDEPREAEIAREIVQENSWAVPLFNGMPFVEKPPFYYDVSALIYSFCPHPGALRLHSAILGCLMLAALYFFALKRCGSFIALCACALCISMPQFYRAAHWILLDIGVGAWVTAGLVCYGLWSFQEREKKSHVFAILFFLFAALSMLTKGLVTIVYLGIIILPHCFFFRRKQLPPVWTCLFFLIPVGIWLCFFYREGGIYFLHEHFVNNTVGRLLHREFRLEGSPVIISDVGHSSPFLFYFARFPEMFGAAGILLPFATAWAWRTQGWKFFSWKLPEKLQWVWDFLTKPDTETAQEQKDLLCYLMLWSLVPLFVFSIPAIKEVTYLLPSYAGTALFAVCYIHCKFFRKEEKELFWMQDFIIPLLGFILTVLIAVKYSLILLFICTGLIYVWLIYQLVRKILCRNYPAVMLLCLSALVGGVLLGNTPELMVRSRLDRKCYCQLSEKVWEYVGSYPLYLLPVEESIRGALPFYGNKNIRVLSKTEQLYERLTVPGKYAFLLYEKQYKIFLEDQVFVKKLPAYQVIFPGFPEKADTFVLLIPKENGMPSAGKKD